jgi:hypothetical protein
MRRRPVTVWADRTAAWSAASFLAARACLVSEAPASTAALAQFERALQEKREVGVGAHASTSSPIASIATWSTSTISVPY